MPKKKKNPNRGFMYERTEHSPLEKAFADQWEKANIRAHNINFGQGVLQDLFGVGHPMFGHRIPEWKHVVTDSERYVAATVIQWLGSNCGRSFLESVLKSRGLRITEK